MDRTRLIDSMSLILAEADRSYRIHPIFPTKLGRLRILTEEVGEVAKALDPRNGSSDELIEELVQVGAVAVAWVAKLIEEANSVETRTNSNSTGGAVGERSQGSSGSVPMSETQHSTSSKDGGS